MRFEARSAMLLADRDGGKAEPRCLLQHFARDRPLIVPLRGKGRDLVGRETLHHLPDGGLVGGEREIHETAPAALSSRVSADGITIGI